jgi:hypothetical protein
MQKFDAPCFFNGQKSTMPLYVGNPAPEHNPVEHQAKWVSEQKGGEIPKSVLDGLDEIMQIAKSNGISFEELCVYAFKDAKAHINSDSGAVPSVEDKKSSEQSDSKVANK